MHGQSRLISRDYTTIDEKKEGWPLYVPGLISLRQPSSCASRAGCLTIAGQPAHSKETANTMDAPPVTRHRAAIRSPITRRVVTIIVVGAAEAIGAEIPAHAASVIDSNDQSVLSFIASNWHGLGGG